MPFGTTGAVNYRNQATNWAFTALGATRPTAWYASLSTAPLGSTEAAIVAAEWALARQAVAFGAATGGVDANTGSVVFPSAVAGTENWLLIWDSLTGGSLIAYGALAAPVVQVGPSTVVFNVGQLTNTMA